MAIREELAPFADSKTNREFGDSGKDEGKLSLENILILLRVSSQVINHKNPFISILVKDAAEEILRGSEGRPINIVVWDDGDSIEMVADSLEKRLELVFESNGGHWVTVREVTAMSVKGYPRSIRPFRLSEQIGWLFGSIK